jgi:Ca2+-binding EF-hand superfamily protein
VTAGPPPLPPPIKQQASTPVPVERRQLGRIAVVAAAIVVITVLGGIGWSVWNSRPEVDSSASPITTSAEPVAEEQASPSDSPRDSLKEPLKPEYVQLMRRRFAALDSNKDREIGPAEFYKSMPGNSADRFRVLHKFDINKNGRITIDELLNSCRVIILDRDMDGDAKLSKEEFEVRDGMYRLARDPSFEPHDFDGDGFVTIEELERGWVLFRVD